MRSVLFILTVFFLGCSNTTKSKLSLKNSVWVNQDLKFDTIYAEGDSGIYSIYGSGTLLLWDTNHTIKSFSNSFIKNGDSIAWGEPGIILTLGSWKESGKDFITTNKLVERTFMFGTDAIGKIIVDTFHLESDTLVRLNKDRFVRAGQLTNELSTFLNSDWTRLGGKNSR